MTKIGYYNPKNNKYQYSKVISIEGDTVNCLNTSANYPYTESLENLKKLSSAPNPNWHGTQKKPLIKLI